MQFPDQQNRDNDRFMKRRSAKLSAVLLVLRGDALQEIPCSLTDISVSGCAVKSQLPPNHGIQVAVLRIDCPDIGWQLEIAGRLCWNQQTSVGCVSSGFRFRRMLDESVIDQLVSEGIVTRRTNDRQRHGGPIAIRRAHGLPPIAEAKLEDYSSTGVRLSLERSVGIDERLLLSTPSGTSGTVHVVWSTHLDSANDDDRYQCGCMFRNLTTARSFCDALTRVNAGV